jgi:hypothetical protein
MAKVIVYLREQELQALYQLAQKEYRAPKAQAALILKTELERLGMLTSVPRMEQPLREPTELEAHHDSQHAS